MLLSMEHITNVSILAVEEFIRPCLGQSKYLRSARSSLSELFRKPFKANSNEWGKSTRY